MSKVRLPIFADDDAERTRVALPSNVKDDDTISDDQEKKELSKDSPGYH